MYVGDVGQRSTYVAEVEQEEGKALAVELMNPPGQCHRSKGQIQARQQPWCASAHKCQSTEDQDAQRKALGVLLATSYALAACCQISP